QPPHRLDQRRHAAGERAVGPAADAVPHLDLEAAEPEGALAGAGGGDRVADEREPTPRDPGRDADGVVGEVDAVDDRLDDDVLARQRRARDARVTVAEG